MMHNRTTKIQDKRNLDDTTLREILTDFVKSTSLTSCAAIYGIDSLPTFERRMRQLIRAVLNIELDQVTQIYSYMGNLYDPKKQQVIVELSAYKRKIEEFLDKKLSDIIGLSDVTNIQEDNLEMICRNCFVANDLLELERHYGDSFTGDFFYLSTFSKNLFIRLGVENTKNPLKYLGSIFMKYKNQKLLSVDEEKITDKFTYKVIDIESLQIFNQPIYRRLARNEVPTETLSMKAAKTELLSFLPSPATLSDAGFSETLVLSPETKAALIKWLNARKIISKSIQYNLKIKILEECTKIQFPISYQWWYMKSSCNGNYLITDEEIATAKRELAKLLASLTDEGPELGLQPDMETISPEEISKPLSSLDEEPAPGLQLETQPISAEEISKFLASLDEGPAPGLQLDTEIISPEEINKLLSTLPEGPELEPQPDMETISLEETMKLLDTLAASTQQTMSTKATTQSLGAYHPAQERPKVDRYGWYKFLNSSSISNSSASSSNPDSPISLKDNEQPVNKRPKR